MPVSYKTFSGLIAKAETYRTKLNEFKTKLQAARNKYTALRKAGGKFVQDAGGKVAIEADEGFKSANKEAQEAFKAAMTAQRAFYTKKQLEYAKNNPLIAKLFNGESVGGEDITKTYPNDYPKDGETKRTVQTMPNNRYKFNGPLKLRFTKNVSGDIPYYDETFKPNAKNVDVAVDDLYDAKKMMRTLVDDPSKGGQPQPPATAPAPEKAQTPEPTAEERKQTLRLYYGEDGLSETEIMTIDSMTPEQVEAEIDRIEKERGIDQEDAQKLAEEAAKEAKKVKEAKEAAEKQKVKDDKKIKEQEEQREEEQVEATLKAQQGGKINIDVDPEEQKNIVDVTEIPRETDNTPVVEQGRNELTPEQAMKMSTLDVSKEEKDVDDMPIKDVRKRIEALHTLYEDVIKVFQTPGHKKDREQSKKNDATARKHLKMMLKAVREYYAESSSMQVGVIIPAHQLVASIMSKIGMQMPQASAGAPPPPPPASGTQAPEDDPPPQAEGKEEGKEESKSDEDEEKESTAGEKPTPPTAKGGVGSVKAHAGDALQKSGDRFGHGFHVSVNYRNSGLEAYQRRAVGRHGLKDDAQEKTGRVADPQPQLNQPALARYIQKIPGFKG